MKETRLIIDTSRSFILLGLIQGDKYSFKKVECGRSISVYLLKAIEDFLRENNCTKNDLTAICCGRGPGAFTGIRLALSIGKTMAYALNIQLYSFSSLVIYSLFDDARKVISVDDARSHKYYYSIIDKNTLEIEEKIDEDLVAVSYCDVRDDYKKISTRSFINITTEVITSFNNFSISDFDNVIKLENHFTFKPSYIKKLDCDE